MKRLVYIMLAALVMAQSLVNVSIGLYYQFNKAYIAQKLCVNANKPQLHCNGQCYLSKMLKKADERENKAYAFAFKEKDEINISNTTHQLAHSTPFYTVTAAWHTYKTRSLTTGFAQIVQPPPIAA